MGVAAGATNRSNQLTEHSIQISVKGQWQNTPAVEVNGQVFAVTGKYIKIAALYDEIWMDTEVKDPEECAVKIKELRNAVPADILSFAPRMPEISPAYDYAKELESIAIVRTDSFKNWWEGLSQVSRKNVRRSQKRGIEIRLQEFGDELVHGISAIQNESPIRQGRKYPHYNKTFEQVMRDHSGFVDRSDFLCAYHDGQMVGFLKLVYRGEIASILQLNSMLAHYDKRPSNALLARAVEQCEAKGIRYMTYGRFNYGNKGDSSLREFKMRNGFEEMLAPRYYIPLTTWGKICIKCRLYRGLYDILPATVIRALLTARTKWYNLVRSQ